MELNFPMKITVFHDPRVSSEEVNMDCIITMPVLPHSAHVLSLPCTFQRLAEEMRKTDPPVQSSPPAAPLLNSYETLALVVAAFSLGVYIGAGMKN